MTVADRNGRPQGVERCTFRSGGQLWLLLPDLSPSPVDAQIEQLGAYVEDLPRLGWWQNYWGVVDLVPFVVLLGLAHGAVHLAGFCAGTDRTGLLVCSLIHLIGFGWLFTHYPKSDVDDSLIPRARLRTKTDTRRTRRLR